MMKTETVFEVIAAMKKELIAWDEFSKQCDKEVRSASINTLEELESRLRERADKNEPIVCGCGLILDTAEIYEKHKMFCGVANR